MTYRNGRILGLMTLFCMCCAIQARQQRQLGDLGFAMDVIEHSYVEPVDRRELYRAAMKGMIDSLDTYSGYIEPKDFPSFQSQIHQEFGGLGIVIERRSEMDRLQIFSVLFDSPAFKAGVLAGDVIEKIDEHSAIGLDTEDATQFLRGAPDTEVTLTIRRDGSADPIKIKIRRAIIETESVTGDSRLPDGRWEFMMQAAPKIAYLRVEIFGEKTPNELRTALMSIRDQASGVIIDLRDNAGGLLPTATEICDMFLEDGVIVSTAGRDGILESTRKATAGVILPESTPVVILVNDMSASASEVTAACLQDRQRATIIGERTFGKGSVQNVVELEGGKAALRLTSAHYFPPSGRNIHKRPKAKEDDVWGVVPDKGLVVTLTEDQKKSVYERLRDRGNPLRKRDADESARSTIQENNEALLKRDPSLSKDPQLLRAVEYLMKGD
jgi:carboxyl-terminal processing protease